MSIKNKQTMCSGLENDGVGDSTHYNGRHKAERRTVENVHRAGNSIAHIPKFAIWIQRYPAYVR